MSRLTYAQAVPKAELHVHLEGAIRPETLLVLAQRNGVALPAQTVEEARNWIQFRDFMHFLQVFRAACSCLCTTEDFEQAVYELGAELASQNVRYAEVTFTEATHFNRGIAEHVYLDGLARGRSRVKAELGVELGWIFNIVRYWEDASLIDPLAEHTTKVAIEGQDIGVVALGLAGAEAYAGPEHYTRWFDEALAAGLHSAPHAGEHGGPESVWGAVRALRAERLGHGVRSVEDPALVTHLAERRIPLDVCPISNVRLGVAESLETHPLPRLLEAGVIVTVNSDDPAIFNTTLTDDYTTLVEPFGLSVAQIDEISLNGFRSSFLPPDRKIALEAEVRRELTELKRVHLSADEV